MVESLGFTRTSGFDAATDGKRFSVFLLPNPDPVLKHAVERGAADTEQAGDARVGLGEHRAGVPDLLGCYGQGTAEALAAGAGGVQALEGALD